MGVTLPTEPEIVRVSRFIRALIEGNFVGMSKEIAQSLQECLNNSKKKCKKNLYDTDRFTFKWAECTRGKCQCTDISHSLYSAGCDGIEIKFSTRRILNAWIKNDKFTFLLAFLIQGRRKKFFHGCIKIELGLHSKN